MSSGLDVDGVGVSADMIAACGEAALRAGCRPNPYLQSTHALDLPRRYGAIVMCDALGLWITRQQDWEGLHRARQHLRPQGVLILDSEVAGFDDIRSTWEQEPVDDSPPPIEDRKLARDGFEYVLRHRITALDPEARQVTRELQAWQRREGQLITHETRSFLETMYRPGEITSIPATAGSPR